MGVRRQQSRTYSGVSHPSGLSLAGADLCRTIKKWADRRFRFQNIYSSKLKINEDFHVPVMPSSSIGSGFTHRSKKWLKESSKLTVSVVFTSALVVFVIGPYLAIKQCKRIPRFINDKRRSYQFRHGRLPKSKPISQELVEAADHRSSISPASILSLPIEIRQQIYELVFPTKKVYQPCLGPPKYPLFEYHGPQPPHWPPHQQIRSDEDPPSQSLGAILRNAGSYLDPIPAPKRRGCVVYSCLTQLICGDMSMELDWGRDAEPRSLTDIMRSSRTIYGDLLHHFYARNTFSFFGAESLLYFVRNTSPEGLRLIRYAHLAIPLQSEGWMSRNSKALVTKAFGVLQEQFENLEQLDVEVVILWSQPAEPQLMAAWLRDKVFGQLHGLEKLVVKVSVYKSVTGMSSNNPYDPPEMEPLSSWSEEVYTSVKKAAASEPGN